MGDIILLLSIVNRANGRPVILNVSDIVDRPRREILQAWRLIASEVPIGRHRGKQFRYALPSPWCP